MSYTPEARLVTLSVREPDAAGADSVRAAAEAVRDWDTVVALAARHRVAAYVRRAATRAGLALPKPAECALREVELSSVASVLRLDVELRRVVQEFARARLPALVLKGPVLARTIYGSSTLRPYGDLDLTVRDDDEAAAVRVLVERGFEEVPYEAETARRRHAGHVHGCAAFHRQFTSDDGQVLLELHTDPLQLGLRPTCEAGRWQRAQPVRGLAGALMLCSEDQVVQLSAHVHKHGFSRLIWLKDLDLLLRRHGHQLDWSLVARVARDEGVLGSVWYSLHLAAVLLRAPVPPVVLRRLRPSLSVRLVYGLVWPVAEIADLEGRMRRRAVQFHAAESWRGMLPGLVTMGRRGTRARATVRALLRH